MRSISRLSLLLSMLLIAAGCGQTTPQASVPTATAVSSAVTQVPTAAPSAVPTAAGTPNLIKFIFSATTDTGIDGGKLPFVQAQGKACNGKFTVQYEIWSNGDLGKSWDREKEIANAERAANDPDVMVYLGPDFSGAAKLSIPILNRANLAMVSAGATLPGLTKPNMGDPGEPEIYYPTGKRNFARVMPTDEIQGTVGAVWAKQLGATAVAIIYEDLEPYSKIISNIFEKKAKEIGLPIVAKELYLKEQPSYQNTINAVIAAKPDLVYFVGLHDVQQVIESLRQSGYTGKLLGTENLSDAPFIQDVGGATEGAYLTIGGTGTDMLSDKGKAVLEAFKTTFKHDPDGYTLFAYDASALALAGFERVCTKDRAAVRDAIIGMKDFEGSLGTYNIDANGDTSLTTMSGFQLRQGELVFVTQLSE